MSLVISRPTRSSYHAALTDPTSSAWNDLKQKGKETKLPMITLLRKECGEPEPGLPENVVYDFMAREGIYPESSYTRPAITVQECLNTPFRANLLFSHWDLLYQSRFWKQANRNLDVRTYGTTDELDAGSIYRPYSDTPVRSTRGRTPSIALAELISGVTTLDTDQIRSNTFTLNDKAGNLIKVPELGVFPEIQFTLQSGSSGMEKVGVKLTTSRESKFRESYVQVVDRVVTQVAQLQETQLAVQAAKQIYDARDNTNNPKITGIPESVGGIIEVNTSAKDGYRIDRLITNLTTFRSWVEVLYAQQPSTGTATQVGTESRVPGLFGPVRIMNDLQSASAIGYFPNDDATTVGLQADELLGFDQSMTLDFFQQAQGMVDEEAYKVETQEWNRVISMIYGQKIFDANSIQVFVTA